MILKNIIILLLLKFLNDKNEMNNSTLLVDRKIILFKVLQSSFFNESGRKKIKK